MDRWERQVGYRCGIHGIKEYFLLSLDFEVVCDKFIFIFCCFRGY